MAAATTPKEKITELAGRFTLGQKVLMVGVAIAVFAGVMLISRSASETQLTPLYSNLQPEDAAAITEKLTAEGATYQLADGGATVMVDRAKVYDLRLQMAAENLPAGGDTGYSLLDKQGIGTSEFSQQVGFQRAMEGELSKTIQTMDPVQTAVVHLALPKDDAFARADEKASASVLVRTKPGKTLDAMQVQAIVHLVASSIQKLEPDAVTVTDSNGAVLAAPGKDGSDLNASDVNGRQRNEFEKTMGDSITSLLEPVVGPGNARVSVNAQLDFDKTEETSERYTQPSGAAQGTPSAQTTKTETMNNAAAADGGVVGPDGQQLDAAAGGTNYELSEGSQQFALDRVVASRKSAPGGVERLSVAVLVDTAKVTPEQVQQISNLVGAAAGINAQRGDRLEVTRLDFDKATVEAQQQELAKVEAAEAQAKNMEMVRQGVIALVLLIVCFFVWRSFKKASRRRREVLYAQPVRELPAAPMDTTQVTSPLASATIDLTPEPEPEPVLATRVRSPEDVRRESVQADVADMIDRQPAEVAQLLRGWLGDRRR